MPHKAIAIFTGKSIDTIFFDGGTQSWRLVRANALQHDYVVLFRNAHIEWVQGDEPHGTVFLIGRLSDVVPSTETKDRWKLLFSHYAKLSVASTWRGWRNPVRYTNLEALNIDPTKLTFLPMPKRKSAPQVADGMQRNILIKELSAFDARPLIAAYHRVKPEAVEIIIKG